MDNTVEVQELGKVMITPKGEYSLSKSYEILDAVSYNGSSYVSKINDNTSVPTSDAWQLLAQKGDIYDVTEEDLQRIAEQITNNANSAFNQNANSKTEAYNTNATEKLDTYNSNHTAKLKEYNNNATSKLSAYNANTVTKTTEYNSNHTNKINTYNTNASNKVDAYNTNADARLEEYNTNADNKIAEYDEHSKELNNKIVSIGNDYRMVKDQLLYTGEDTDTFIHVEDSAMAELQEIKVDGVLQQKTTQGYNILDENSWKNGYHVTGNSINTSNNGCHVDFQKIGSTTQYFIRIEALQNCRIGRFFSAFTNESQDTSIGKVSEGIYDTVFSAGQVKYITVNVPAGAFYVGFSIYLIQKIVNGEYVDAIPIYENYKDYFKICISTTYQKDYEPYTGGQPSPNPDYPQEIKTITDSLKVTSCDDGLFDGEFRQGSWNSINDNTRCFNKNNIYVEPGNYLLITNLDINNYRYGILVSDDNYPAQVENFSYDSGWKQANKFEFNLTETGNLGINVSSINNANINPSTFANVKWLLIKLDLVSIIEAKLPEGEFIGYINTTNRDILSTKYNRNAAVYQWVLNKYIAKITIDGTKGSFSMPSVGRFNIDNIISNYLKTSQSYGITTKCDNYISFPQTLSNSDFDKLTSGYNYGIGLGGGTANNIRIKNVNFSNVEDFKNDLKQHPITLYYILNIESRQTLDLDVTDMPMSYKDITNIFTDSDLLPTINAKYYRVFDKTIQNAQINEKTLKQEITDLNATVSALDTRLKALETKTVEEPTESEGTV